MILLVALISPVPPINVVPTDNAPAEVYIAVELITEPELPPTVIVDEVTITLPIILPRLNTPTDEFW